MALQNDLLLLSDEPATTDLLAFDAIAHTIVDALFDDNLNPIALGISGSWGSGKTTVLNLVAKHAQSMSEQSGRAVIVVRADPWRYDPTVGTKESLIAAVLKALQTEFKGSDPVVAGATTAFKKLVKRINWSKAIKVAARTALTAQLPSMDDVFSLVGDDPESLESDKDMDSFRDEFESLLRDPALDHISQVVVLVDDLDRCLPDTVVDTLEAIRLFLSAEGMSFVIAADEQRVSEAIQQKIMAPPTPAGTETVASLYLHKIVQTTVPLPALSYFDTRAYLFLLLVRSETTDDEFRAIVTSCDGLRTQAGSLDDLALPSGVDLSLQMATASRLTPVLYEKFQGNPRRIKRFMNDLYVRRSVAGRRGISLEPDAIAKLMLVEKLFDKDFETLLQWLASGELRAHLDAVQEVAPGDAPATAVSSVAPQVNTEEFSSTMVRWAQLPPKLDATDVSGYLTLAAAFQGKLLVDESLSEKLRDLAAALTSSSKVERASVNEDELQKLLPADVVELLGHLGRRMRDDPSLQMPTANAIITLGKLHPTEITDAASALGRLPGQEVKASTVLLLQGSTDAYKDVLAAWESHAGATAMRAIASIRSKQGA